MQSHTYADIIVCIFCIYATQTSSKPSRLIKGDSGYIEGFLTHGVNNFNGQLLINLDDDGFGSSFFQRATYEQQVYNPKGKFAILPTPSTSRSKLLSTGRDFIIGFEGAFLAPMTPNPDLFNIPYLDIGTVVPGSLNIDQREKLTKFDDLIDTDPSELYPATYLPEGALLHPRLGDWEQASGVIEIECNTGRTGPAIVKVKACNLLASSLYTVWEIGIENPGIEGEETFYSHPSGGVGNVIRTNLNGYGELEYRTPWCPIRDCVPGESVDCQLYFSIFHHPDYIIYGGDFAAVAWKPFSYPAGVAGSNHLWFPIYGTYLQEPLNRFQRKCRKEGRKKKYY